MTARKAKKHGSVPNPLQIQQGMVITMKQTAETAGYGTMFWMDGFRGGSELGFLTPSYGAVFDAASCSVTHLGAIAAADDTPLLTPRRLRALPELSVEWNIHVDSRVYEFAGGTDADSAAMLQAGQYINRMDVSGCRFESMHGEAFSAPVRVEVTAHRGFISLCLIVEPETDLRFCILTARVRVQSPVQSCGAGGGCGIVRYSGGEGLYVLSADGVDPEQQEDGFLFRLPCPAVEAGGQARIGVKLFPSIGDGVPDKMFSAPPLAYCMQARILKPYQEYLPVSYDRTRQWYQVTMPGKIAEGFEETVCLETENPYNEPILLPVMISKAVPLLGSAQLLDADGVPLGIAVQQSAERTFRGGRTVDYQDLCFELPLGPSENAKVYVKIYYAALSEGASAVRMVHFWDHRARYAQSRYELSAGNASALAQIDTERGQRGRSISQLYPLACESGGELLTRGVSSPFGTCCAAELWDSIGQRIELSALSARVLSEGPYYTEMTQGCVTSDGNIGLRMRFSSYAANDCMRLFVRIRAEVLRPCCYGRFVLFALETAGNALLRIGQHDACYEPISVRAGGARYIRKPEPLLGHLPFISVQSGVTHGVIVRDYHARIAGQNDQQPYFAVFGTENGECGARYEVVLPPSQALSIGDFADLDLELLLLPQAEQYYGSNAQFADALRRMDGARLVQRETQGNDLTVYTACGQTVRNYPIAVKASQEKAEFTVHGGIGLMPISICGVASPQGHALYTLRAEQWNKLSDRYQCRYDAASNSYCLTFCVSMDDSTGGKGEHAFRFE